MCIRDRYMGILNFLGFIEKIVKMQEGGKPVESGKILPATHQTMTYEEYMKKDPNILSVYVLKSRFDIPHRYRLEVPIDFRKMLTKTHRPVSYTHLTLPTIYSV
eukprot:TRINITY_DN18393_c0_g1_i1.p1 TRINITY_DN18393_c0_g1~~TRINITY_DN18393_c0_g1_i1.p1  ORF type:complete len:104 (-),score=26.48 TRINITY_DN18393_c0_g1_i1:32-343(-)